MSNDILCKGCMRHRPAAGFVDVGRRNLCSTCAPRLVKNLAKGTDVVGHFPTKHDRGTWGSAAGAPITKAIQGKAHEKDMKKKYREGGVYFKHFD